MTTLAKTLSAVAAAALLSGCAMDMGDRGGMRGGKMAEASSQPMSHGGMSMPGGGAGKPGMQGMMCGMGGQGGAQGKTGGGCGCCAGMKQGAGGQGGMMNHGGMNHGAAGQGGMDHHGMHHGPGGHGGMDHSAMQHGGMAGGTPDTPAAREYQAAMDTMHKRMALRLTGDADRDFAAGMIPHHQGAVDMARVVLEHGKDPELKRLAKEIIAAQEKEIAMMQAWLKKKGS